MDGKRLQAQVSPCLWIVNSDSQSEIPIVPSLPSDNYVVTYVHHDHDSGNLAKESAGASDPSGCMYICCE
jgi:hypothetical protein